MTSDSTVLITIFSVCEELLKNKTKKKIKNKK